MRCFKCNSELSPTRNRCSKCGTDVRLYRRLCKSSNVYYNAGLDKAKVRDLTGAVQALKMSVSLDKTNIDARNLLGLVYFEMGETAMALREWVISSNMLDYDNDAIYFLQTVQGNPNKLDIIAESIKKYNFSLKYAKEDGEDLAIIQLKKVIQTNPNLLRAYQLLALLYIHQKQYKKAEAILKKCLKIDKGNTTARRYLLEIKNHYNAKEPTKKALPLPTSKTVKEDDDFDADQVIIPVYTKTFGSYFLTALDVMIGLVLGLLILYFVIVPGVKTRYAAKYQEQLTSYQTTVSADKVTIASLEDSMEKLEKEKKALEEEIANQASSTENPEENPNNTVNKDEREQYEALLNLLLAKVNPEAEVSIVANARLIEVNEDYTDAMKAAYEAIQLAYVEESQNYFKKGYKAYQKAETLNAAGDETALDKYNSAAKYFEVCLALNPEYSEAYVWMGVCKHYLGLTAQAKYYYEYYLEHYGDVNADLTNVAKTQLDSIVD